MNPTSTYDIIHFVYWDYHIVLNLFLSGIGIGTFIFAAIIGLIYDDSEHEAVNRVGAIISPITIILGAIFLFTDLGHPFRAWKIYTDINFSSPISWGGWATVILIIISSIYAVLPKNYYRTRQTLAISGIPIAFITGLSHGLLLSTVKANPIWFSGPSTVLAMTEFITTGIGAVVLALSLSKGAKLNLSSIEKSRNILGSAIIIHIFTLFLWITTNVFGYFHMKEALLVLNSKFGLIFWVGAVFIGLIMPLILGGYAVKNEEKTGTIKTIFPLLTSIFVLIGGFIHQYVWIIGGQLY
ncbi:MAG: polysulfide reductase NrfD [Nitrospirae bacterium]|nr:polysulfide reductase NrfD [Nitrospirota bacterium]